MMEMLRCALENLDSKFIHRKSRSIFIHVEMDLQYKQIQNLYCTNESGVCTDCFCSDKVHDQCMWLMKNKMKFAMEKKVPEYIYVKSFCLKIQNFGFQRKLWLFSAHLLY